MKIKNPLEFNKTRFPTVKATVAAIIEKDDKILLTKRAEDMEIEGGKWCFPGGHIDIGETAREAIKREIKEETSLELTKIQFLKYHDEILPDIKNHSLTLFFTGSAKGKPTTSNEVSQVKWFDRKEALEVPLAFKHRAILEGYYNGTI